MKKMTLSQLHGNLKTFSKEFIGAGSRNSVVGLYRKLIELGAIPSSKEKDNSLISSSKRLLFYVLTMELGVNSLVSHYMKDHGGIIGITKHTSIVSQLILLTMYQNK